jgi:hypothetical protein
VAATEPHTGPATAAMGDKGGRRNPLPPTVIADREAGRTSLPAIPPEPATAARLVHDWERDMPATAAGAQGSAAVTAAGSPRGTASTWFRRTCSRLLLQERRPAAHRSAEAAQHADVAQARAPGTPATKPPDKQLLLGMRLMPPGTEGVGGHVGSAPTAEGTAGPPLADEPRLLLLLLKLPARWCIMPSLQEFSNSRGPVT